MRVLARVKFNDDVALVLDKKPVLTYVSHSNGDYLVGSDESKTFFDCLYYERPSGRFRAFAGREFDLPMKDGTVTHCNGQYWSGVTMGARDEIGVRIGHVTATGIDDLKRIYVFAGYQADVERIGRLVEQYDGKLYGYWEYEALLKKEKGESCERR